LHHAAFEGRAAARSGQLKLSDHDGQEDSGGSVYSALRSLSDAVCWYAVCIVSWMLTMLTVPGLTLLFLGVVVGLGTALVWMLWEVEQMSKPHRNRDRLG
jgi:hypothetical protein